MLTEAEIEKFLSQFARRIRELDENNATGLQQIVHDEAGELQAKLAASPSEPAAHLGAVAEGPGDQTTRLPTPPKPNENPGDVFDPQRDTSPG